MKSLAIYIYIYVCRISCSDQNDDEEVGGVVFWEWKQVDRIAQCGEAASKLWMQINVGRGARWKGCKHLMRDLVCIWTSMKLNRVIFPMCIAETNRWRWLPYIDGVCKFLVFNGSPIFSSCRVNIFKMNAVARWTTNCVSR